MRNAAPLSTPKLGVNRGAASFSTVTAGFVDMVLRRYIRRYRAAQPGCLRGVAVFPAFSAGDFERSLCQEFHAVGATDQVGTLRIGQNTMPEQEHLQPFDCQMMSINHSYC